MLPTPKPTEQIVIVGAGVAGLFAAMMLAGEGRTVTVLDRDPAPPEGLADGEDADRAFRDWHRRGVGQMRHSHAFLARLVNIVRAHHPALLDQWRAAGCREVGLEDLLPSTLKDRYTPAPGDADMSILMSRRITMELVTRRYVAGLPGVTLRPDTFVTGFLTRKDNAGAGVVEGVTLDGGERLQADTVIDAEGRLSQAADWLAEAGVAVEASGEPCGILYYPRHWRLNPGQGEPPRNGAPGAGDMGYLKFGLFNADNGCFSVTLAVPEVETELRQAIVRPPVFDAVCNAIPGLAPWIEPERSTAQSKVFAMGDLTSRWRRMVANGAPVARGLYLIGDGLIRSNPLYGRGTSFAAIEAEVLARAFAASKDPTARAILYDSLVEQALRPFYDDMLDQDRSAIRRARAARAGAPRSLKGRVIESFVVDGAGLAVRDDLPAFRAALRAFHMLDQPRAWLKEPRHMGVVLKTWARGKKQKAHLYPQKLGPDRAEMLALLGIDSGAGEMAA
jgi:2-polyprenyl-6-methoxyphenol hydroxylase-like FAD-dependent oxidoreductase